MSAHILLVEDEPGLVLTLTDRLESEGYRVARAGSGEQGLARIRGEPFDLVILDLMLPGCSGLAVCRELRAAGNRVPVLMLTARSEVEARVAGLETGADDYLVKPFAMTELMARVRALLRRHQPAPAPERVAFGEFELDRKQGQLRRAGRPVELSAREFQLLSYLAARRGAVLSRAQILRDLWGYRGIPRTRTVDVHVAQLRKKIEPQPRRPQFILTVQGEGYRFV